MKVSIFNKEGKTVGELELPKVFEVGVNRDLLHQVVIAQLSNARAVVAAVKNRGEVRGGGKKPWRQKGTGRARHGSIRSPLWRGGGVTHGPNPERNYKKKVNRKMAKKALAMAVAAKARDGELIVLDALKLESGKTRDAAGILKNFAKQKSFSDIGRRSKVVLLPNGSVSEERGFRNLAGISVASANQVTAKDLLEGAILIMPQSVIEVLENRVKSR